jgi:hypothetical protein
VPRSWVKQDSKERRDSKGTRDCQGPQGSEERLVTWAPRSLERQGWQARKVRRDSVGSGVRRTRWAQCSQEQRDCWETRAN